MADSQAAVRQIAKTPGLRDEAQRMLPVFREQIDAPAAEGLPFTSMLARHAMLLGVSDRTDVEWADLFRIYHQTLAKFSMGAVEAAFSAWNRCELYPNEPGRHGFFPKPAELHALAQKHMNEIGMAHYRAKKALEFVEDKGLEWTEERRKAELDKSIAAGHLTPDGKLNLDLKGFAASLSMDRANNPRLNQSPQQLAESLRAQAAQIDDVI